jgi:Domain of unknown function (DUF3472)/Domain of unknown function (DUF5077)
MPRRPGKSALILALGVALTLASAFADEKLAGIACRSVHLNFPAPEGTAYYNEVTVEKSAEGTYFCVCGFNQGYFGIQEQRPGKKVVIFSVWDPGKQDDPNSVDPSKRVKLVAKDDAVRVGRFGNEGTGGQSFLDLDWKPGETYRFLVTAKVDGDRTNFSASIAPPGATAWRHLATFSTLAKGKLLGGYYSFIEDFRRNKVSATIERKATFGGGYVQDKQGRWLPLARAKFTADSNPAKTIDAGPEAGRFFLATGGKVENQHVKLGQSMELEPSPDRKETDTRPAQIPEIP